jgi:hypothetical protein
VEEARRRLGRRRPEERSIQRMNGRSILPQRLQMTTGRHLEELDSRGPD